MIRYLYIPFFSAPSKEDEGLTMTPVPGLPVPCVVGSCSVLGRGLADLMPKRAGWVSFSRSTGIFYFIVKGLGRRCEVKQQSGFLKKRRENSFDFAYNICSSS